MIHYVLEGPKGSGKSTLSRELAQLHQLFKNVATNARFNIARECDL